MKLITLTIALLFSLTALSNTVSSFAIFGQKGPGKKMLYKSKDFKVVSISLDAKEVLPEHTVPFNALLIAYKGDIKYYIGAKEVVLKQGEFHKIKKGQSHKIIAISDAQMLLVRP